MTRDSGCVFVIGRLSGPLLSHLVAPKLNVKSTFQLGHPLHTYMRYKAESQYVQAIYVSFPYMCYLD